MSSPSSSFASLSLHDLDGVNGGVNWRQAFETANSGASHGAAAGTAIGAVAGGAIGATGGAVAVPGLGSVPGWLAGSAAGGGIGAPVGGAIGYMGGLAKGIYDTWGQ